MSSSSSASSVYKRGFSTTLIGPAAVVLLLSVLLVTASLLALGGDPLALARLGPRFEQGDSQAEAGYDGQFVYYIARDPRPQAVAPLLDVPAYRYQRILMPLLARSLAFGQLPLIPWTIIAINIAALTAGTWAVSRLLAGWGVSRWYALIYGLWAGFTLSLVVDLPEPLAYGLVAGGFLAVERNRKGLGWLMLSLALFAREMTILFTAALLLIYFVQRSWRDLFGLAVVAVLPFFFFQGWLWLVFGSPGISSGGEGATGFEIIPYMGLWRIGFVSPAYLLAMAVVFVPTIVLPSAWGMLVSAWKWLAGERSWILPAFFANAFMIAILPYSGFRETGGIIRFATGMILALLLYAGRYQNRRVLNYSAFLCVLNLFLVK